MADEIQDPPEGDAGAPAEPEAVVSSDGINTDELLDSIKPEEVSKTSTAAAPDEEFVKKLESLDPASLPEGLRRKLENPFLSQYTKKTTEWDDERKRYIAAIERLSSRQSDVPQTEDQRELLRQKFLEGDQNAINAMLDERLDQKYGPDIQNMRLNGALDYAEQQFPGARAAQNQIAQVIAANPDTAPYIKAAMNSNPQTAGKFLSHIAMGIDYPRVVAENKALKEDRKAYGKQVIEEYKRRVAGLPASTSRAGSTPSRGPTKDNMSLREAMEAAWNEQGGS